MREVVPAHADGVAAPDDGPTVDAEATLRIGLSTLFASGAPAVQVTDGGRVLGTVTLEALQDAVVRSTS
jgi:osmoprotectant transport system ATP-binding protein